MRRSRGANKKPVTGQFFARDPYAGSGTIFYNDTQSGTPDTVYLKVYKTPSGGSESFHATHRQSLVGGAYAFFAPIPAGLVTYRVVYGTTTGGVDTDAATVSDLVCGDTCVIEGQSNALAIDGKPDDLTPAPFVRTYAWTTNTWGHTTRKGNDFLIGYWRMPLALYLKSTYNMQICIINGTKGGTRIDQHQPSPCGMGPKGDQLREAQRTLPCLFPHMSILSTIGIDSTLGHDCCHYSVADYQIIANLMAPLVERDFYDDVPSVSVTAPNLQRTYYTNTTRNQIALECDQPTLWNSTSIQHFYLDDVAATISSGSHSGPGTQNLRAPQGHPVTLV